MSERWGATLSRKTMADWVRIASDWAEPIYKLMLERLLRGQYLQCDETPVKFIDPDEKGRGAVQGYLWVVSRPGGDVVFDWRLSRRHGELTSLLGEDYVGILQSDGYEAYASYARTHPTVAWVGCWAHARRRFFEAQSENPRIAKAALRLIGSLLAHRLLRTPREGPPGVPEGHPDPTASDDEPGRPQRTYSGELAAAALRLMVTMGASRGHDAI